MCGMVMSPRSFVIDDDLGKRSNDGWAKTAILHENWWLHLESSNDDQTSAIVFCKRLSKIEFLKFCRGGCKETLS